MLMGRGRFRNWWSLGAVAAIAVTVAWLLYLVWRTPYRSDLATYGAFVVSVVAIVVGWVAWAWRTWAWRKGTVGPASSENLDRVADQLADTVQAQWTSAAGGQGLIGTDPIRITWGRPSLPMAGPVAAAVGSHRFPPLPGLAPIREADLASGQAADLHTVYGGLQSGRLIIAGPPGSGKTGTAVLLVLAALRHRQGVPASDRPQVPVPVLLAAQDWNPARQPAREWLVGKLQDTYAIGADIAAALLDSGRISVILDGLDEISPDLQPVALQALSQQATFRLVLLSRTSEMAAAAARMGTLLGAAAIELNPVDPADAASYLERSQLHPPPPEWQELTTCIRTDPASPLSRVLTNPVMLSLVGTIYGAGSFSSPPIDDLFRLPDETSITDHLLTAFVANAYDSRWRGRSWTATQAEGWLALIGSQMRALSTEGYAWRQTACAMPNRLLGLLSGTATGLSLLVTFTVLGVIHQVFGDRMQLGTAIWALAVVSIVPAVVAALLVAGINSGSLLSLLLTIASRLPTPIVPVPAGSVTISTSTGSLRAWRSELLRQRQGTGSSATNPREDLVQSRRRALISTAMVGVTVGLLAAAMVLIGVHMPRDATIVFVCYCMAVTVLGAPWGSYQLARSWFSVRRELPYRLLGFLDDARDRSVLRSAGPQFEFRNNLIREYYRDPARLPEVQQEISELTDWVLENLEIRESCQHVGANESDIRQAVSSLVTETILAGQRFAADAAARQAALERVRVRLNELGRRSAFEESLVAREAPGLGAAVDPSRVILTSTMDDLARLIDRLSSASVGISGIRGIGKSTLIRWLCTERNVSRRLPVLGIYVTAPVEYDARDFLVHLYITLCKAVLADDRFTGRRSRQHWSLRRIVLGIILVAGGLSLYYHRAVTAIWAHNHGALWFVAASVLFTGGLFVLVSVVIGMWRRRGGGGRRSSIEAIARDRLRHLRYQVMETTGQTGNLKGPFGLSFGGSRSRQVTENQMTLPELVESYREFAELIVSTLQESARQDGPLAIAQVRLVVGIDEIDRIEDAENAEKFLNDIKAIFGIPNCFYIASLSADALANFERRVVSTRTAFDTTFDTVMRIGPLELRTAMQVLELRAIGLPYPFITLCYVLSGGVPRELMRIARAVFDARNDVRFGSADAGDQGSVACSVIVPRVITREMESLRQGLMPLATQLDVPGATELIGLLDDPDWPSGNTRTTWPS